MPNNNKLSLFLMFHVYIHIFHNRGLLCACVLSVDEEVKGQLNDSMAAVEEKVKAGECGVAGCLSVRQRDLRDSMNSVVHTGAGSAALTATEREQEQCMGVVVYREAHVAGSSDERLLKLCWEADSSW